MSRFSKSIGIFILVLVTVLAGNAILSQINLRYDLTEENIYTLSAGTRKVLENLERPITLKFFYSESYAEVPTMIKDYAQEVEDLLKEYRLASNGRLKVERYDPVPDSTAEDRARRYGVQGQQIGLMGPKIYIGLVAVSGDKEEVIPVLDPAKRDSLEYDITRKITRVETREKPRIGIVSSLPVMGRMGPRRSPFGQNSQSAWIAFQDLEKDYDVVQLQSPLEKIDPGIDALLLVHPKDLKDKDLYTIDQYLLKGGRIAAFLDPKSLAEMRSQANPQMRMMAGKPSGLGSLFPAWGVTFNSRKVVADLEAASQLRGRDNRIVENPTWLSLESKNMNDDDILTAGIESMMLPLAGSFTVETNEDVTVTTLIETSESADLVDARSAQMNPTAVRSSFQSEEKKFNLAVRLSGQFDSAFPEGRPKSKSESETEEKEKEPDQEDQVETESAGADEQGAKADGLQSSSEKGIVILVSDIDFIYDRFSTREAGFLGVQSHEMLNDNIAFFDNVLAQITGNTNLIDIRTRGKTERPFEMVQELQQKAQDKYLREEQKLQEKLKRAQGRLRELQQAKKGDSKLVLTPEQKEEIEKFRKQEYETKRELKLVRRKLRKDIKALGTKVKAINILLMPLLVALAGIGFGIYRKKKA